MQAATRLTGGCTAVILAATLGGCGKVKQNDPGQSGKVRAEAKRQQLACGSSAAYDRLKGLMFDQAIATRQADRAKLDMLADYSFARMEDPVVKGWDPALDITRCSGRFVLQLPPGAKQAFGGETHLDADINYTAQAAADGSGFVYRLTGAEPVVARLATFNLAGGAYRPPPAIDDRAGPDAAGGTAIAQADLPAALPAGAGQRSAPPVAPGVAREVAPPAAPTRSVAPIEPARPPRAPQRPLPPERGAGPVSAEPGQPVSLASEEGGAAIRAFYGALGSGDGEAASAQVVPEKRGSRAFSPEAITRFYGKLPEPVRLTDVAAVSPGAYRVRYRYSTGRSQCNGSAVVSLTSRGGRTLIRSIRALSGC